MDWDDLEPKNKKKPMKDLEVMSVEAIGEYIDELKEEIGRCETEIIKKKAAKEGAESFFKK
ncbi:MAG: DUF1192 domain-containing protein [Rhodospirillales bacterium]|nr:DUF1192 domain-containing protein [Rhodospirillales bacterium]